MFKKVLVANRGEIAVRIIRTCRALGIETVAVYSDADRRALHVLEADAAVYIGPSPATQSYLNIEAIVRAATESGAEAIHPGYGLLSENADFAQACTSAGTVFVGPSPEAIRTMGDKAAARKLAESHGVPVIPGYDGDHQDDVALLARAQEIGFPVMIKATAGGGGRGMRLVESPDRFEEALQSARRETERAFGEGRLLLERAIVGGRHVEVQILADAHGNVVHLGERDCSVQRRHQKVIEESPSPAVDADLRQRMGEAAVQMARVAAYVNAGTVEFLLDADGSYYFLEMNTRLQVEHGVTELVTGLDLVALQLRIAAGEPLLFTQEGIAFSGHALECRVYAEDPLKSYLPSPGKITSLELPRGEGIRNDVGTYPGDEITTYYDPMLSKLLAWGSDRNEAMNRTESALASYRVEGVRTNLSLLRAIVAHPVFRAGEATTDFLDDRTTPEALLLSVAEGALLAAFGALMLGLGAPADPWCAVGPWRGAGLARADLQHEGTVHVIEGQRIAGIRDEWLVTVAGRQKAVRFIAAGPDRILMETGGITESGRVLRTKKGIDVTTAGDLAYRFVWSFGEPSVAAADSHRERNLTAPMPGLILKVLVKAGDAVHAHQTLVVLEAMKMEHAIEAPYDGVVKAVNCAEGGRVAEGVVLIEMEREAVG